MKIFFYINTISHGGAERVMTNLATEMSKRGHECKLITTYKSTWEYNIAKEVKRVSIYKVRPKSFYSRNIKVIFKLRNFLKKEQPDILITFMGEPNFRGILAKLGTSVKIISSVRNDPNKEYAGRIRSILAKTLLEKADHIIFQTEDARNWFSNHIKSKSSIIFNPVNPIFYNTALKKERKGIITVGRLVEQKNHALLIKAYSLIANKISEELYIYGSGNTDELKKLAESLDVGEKVHFCGQCSDVPSVLAASRLFVLSSNYEGMPNALMEAMAIGLPCISTDCPCGGPKMLFPKNIWHYLTPVGNHIILAERMLEILTNKKEEDCLAFECKTGASKFKSAKVFDNWEEVIKKTISKE